MTLPWMAERIQLRAIASLRPHAGNARVHDAAQLAQIMASMQACGFTNPLLVDEDGVLIADHGRLAAAEALGIAKVPVIVLKHLAPAQEEALRLADNRITENATWDQALMRDALASVRAAEIDLAALGFSADELAAIVNPRMAAFTLPALSVAEARNQHRDMLRRFGAARDTVWIAELGDSMAERNRRAIWGAMNAPGEDAAISRDSLPLASRGFRMVERV
jgi:ParB-like chromosome segregation protein Spo0J